MRVVVLGGPGGIGRYAVRTAAQMPFVEALVVADRDAVSARALADDVGGPAVAAAIDVTDAPALAALLADADVVLNAVGPYFRFGPPVLDAAIAAGCTYVDVCDDWEPTLAMLDRHEAARAAGVTAVLGLGATPGVANLLAAKAVRALDEADAAYTGWALNAAAPARDAPRPSAATVHGFHQMTGDIRVWRGGRPVDERPLQRVELDFPGLGPRPTWTIGHPEPLTLPRTFPALKTCLNVFHAPGWIVAGARALAGLAGRGLLSLERAAWLAEVLEGPPPSDASHRAVLAGDDALPPLFALATGRRGGEPTAVVVVPRIVPDGGMGAATGVPLAVALELVASGALDAPGVHAPEAVIDPDAFLAALAPWCGVALGAPPFDVRFS